MNVKNTILLSLAVLSSTPGTTHPIETYNNPDTPAYNQVRERLYAQGYPAESIEQEIAEIREHFLSEGFNDTQIEQFIHVKNAVETAAKNLAIACKKNPEIKKAIQEWIELLAAKDATTIALAYKTLLPPRMYLEVEKNILESIPKTPTTDHKKAVQRAQRIQAKLQIHPEVMAYLNAVDELFMQLKQSTVTPKTTQQEIADATEMLAQESIFEFMEELAEDSFMEELA